MPIILLVLRKLHKHNVKGLLGNVFDYRNTRLSEIGSNHFERIAHLSNARCEPVESIKTAHYWIMTQFAQTITLLT